MLKQELLQKQNYLQAKIATLQRMIDYDESIIKTQNERLKEELQRLNTYQKRLDNITKLLDKHSLTQ